MRTVIMATLLALSPGTLAAAEPALSTTTDANALRGLADAMLDEGKTWEALAYADRAGDRLRAGEIRLLLGDFAGAEKNFKLILERRPDDSSILLLLARAKRERQAEALADAERAASVPGSTAKERAAAHLFASELKIDLGDNAGAEKSAERAVKESPDDLDALYAVVRLKSDRKNEARPYAERAARAAAKAPLWRRPAAYRLSAFVWLELEEPVRAAESLRRALRFNPEDLDALGTAVKFNKMLSPEELARYRKGAAALAEADEAPLNEEDAKAALTRDPNDLEALRTLVVTARDRGRKAAAEAVAMRFMRSVWKTPVWQQAEAYRTATKLWLDLGRKDLAFHSLSKAWLLQEDSLETQQLRLEVPRVEPELTPEADRSVFVFIYCTAAEMRVALQDRAGAEELIGRALKLDPKHAWALRLKSSLAKSQ